MILHADRRAVGVLRTTADEEFIRAFYIWRAAGGSRVHARVTLQRLETIRYIFMSAVPGDSCGVYVIG